ADDDGEEAGVPEGVEPPRQPEEHQPPDGAAGGPVGREGDRQEGEELERVEVHAWSGAPLRLRVGWNTVNSSSPRAAATTGTTASPLPVKVGYSTKNDSRADHPQRMSTLRRCPWPRRMSRW